MFLSAGQKEAAVRRQQGKSAPTTLAAVRELWARCANASLAAAGRVERIDHRSLKVQNVGRKPQVHEGPNVRAMHKRGVRARSRDRLVRANPFRRGGRAGTRVARYAEIDRGVTRVEYNAALKQAAARTAEVARERTADRHSMARVAVPGLLPPRVSTVAPTPPRPGGARPGGQPAVRPMAASGGSSSLLDRLAREHPGMIAQPSRAPDRQRGR